MYRIIQTCFVLGILSLTGCITVSDSSNIIEGEILRFGLYEYANKTRSSVIRTAPVSATGFTVVEEGHLIKDGDVFEPKKGLGIGFDYILRNLIVDQEYEHEIYIIHPPMVNIRRETHTLTKNSETIRSTDGIYEGALQYFWDYNYEMVPGKWILQIKLDGKVLVSKEFRIGI